MKVAVMQPYIYPYIGYFQLINAVDHFVFYDDVNFIKRGWINRNKILINNEEKLISFPCIKASQNKLINQVEINLNDKLYHNILSTIKLAYSKAPYFELVYPVIESTFKSDSKNIAELSEHSIVKISNYLGIETKFYNSSMFSPSTFGIDKADRLIAITKSFNSKNYINALGGKDIYSKEYFKSQDINLCFLEPSLKPYSQFNADFVEGLSIIDVLMFNSVEEVREMINEFNLI